MNGNEGCENEDPNMPKVDRKNRQLVQGQSGEWYYIDKHGKRRPCKGGRHGGHRHGTIGVARKPRCTIPVKNTTNDPDIKQAIQSLKVAAMSVGRTAASLQRKETQFENHRDRLDNHINEHIIVRHGETIQRKSVQGLKRSSSSSTVEQRAPPEEPPPPKKKRVRPGELTTEAQCRLCFPAGTLGSTLTTAKQFHVSTTCVNYTRCGMANFVHTTEAGKLRGAVNACKEAGVRLPFYVRNRGWDESLQKTSRRAFARKKPDPKTPAIENGPDGKRLAKKSSQVKRVVQLARRKRDAASKRRFKRSTRKPAYSRPSTSIHARSAKGEQLLVITERNVLPTAQDCDRVIPRCVPPGILNSVAAADILAGIRAREEVTADDLRAICDALVEVFESDGCNANISVHNEIRRILDQAHAAGRLYDMVLFLLCHIHGLNLINQVVLQSIDGKLMHFLNDLFCSSAVVRRPGYWSRILDALTAELSDCTSGLRIRHDTSPPPDARAKNEEFLQTCGIDTTQPDVAKLLDILNGEWSLGILIHLCTCVTPCNRCALIETLGHLLGRVVFGRSPDLPIPARWFLAQNCFHWWRLLNGVAGGVGRRAVKRALNPKFLASELAAVLLDPREEREPEEGAPDMDEQESVEAAEGPAAIVDDSIVDAIVVPPVEPTPPMAAAQLKAHSKQYRDPAFSNNVGRAAYQRELGMRSGRMMDMIDTPRSRSKLDIASLACQPVNFAIAWWLAQNKKRHEMAWSTDIPVPILDLMNESISPIVIAQQWFSSRLMQDVFSSGAALVHNLVRCDGTIDPELHECYVRVHMLASSAMSARVEEPLKWDEMRSMSTVDTRIPTATRDATCEWWAALRGCCRGAYFGVPVARLAAYLGCGNHLGTLKAEYLRLPVVRHLLSSTCKSIDGNTGLIENQHARNKRDIEENQGPEMTIAKATIRESTSLKKRNMPPWAMEIDTDTLATLASQDHHTTNDADNVESGRYNGIRMFHNERMHIQSLAYPEANNNPCDQANWDITKTLWERLCDAGNGQELYEQAAKASNVAGYNVLLAGAADDGQAEPYTCLLDSDSAIVDGEIRPQSYGSEFAQLAITNGEDIDGYANPLPILQHVPEWAGDRRWPIALAALRSSKVTLKQHADRWKPMATPIGATGPLPKYVRRKSCLEKGACYTSWRQHEMPVWKRERFKENIHTFLQKSPVSLWHRCLPRPVAITLILVQGRHNDTVVANRIFMVGTYHLAPIDYQLLEYGSYGPELTFPYNAVLPTPKDIVVSKSTVPHGAQQVRGALPWVRLLDVATDILTRSPGMPIADGLSKWYVARLRWSWSCLIDTRQPVIAVTISGVDEASITWIDGPKPTVRRPRAKPAPKPKPTAKPKASAKAKRRPAAPKPAPAPSPASVPAAPLGPVSVPASAEPLPLSAVTGCMDLIGEVDVGDNLFDHMMLAPDHQECMPGDIGDPADGTDTLFADGDIVEPSPPGPMPQPLVPTAASSAHSLLIDAEDVGDALELHMQHLHASGDAAEVATPVGGDVAVSESDAEHSPDYDPTSPAHSDTKTDDEFCADPTEDGPPLVVELENNATDLVKDLTAYDAFAESIRDSAVDDVIPTAHVEAGAPGASEPLHAPIVPTMPEPDSAGMLTVYCLAADSGESSTAISWSRDRSDAIGYIYASGSMLRCNCGTPSLHATWFFICHS